VTPYYEDDLVTLYHGDCREIAEWLAADVLVTDPPYGRGWRQGDLKSTRNAASTNGIANDHDTTTRDAALAAWGDRPSIVFGDLLCSPPTRAKLVCVYYKTDRAAGLRGAIGGVRRDVEAIYLSGRWSSGIGGRSAVFPSRQQLRGAQAVS
jgi:hypothetical protein